MNFNLVETQIEVIPFNGIELLSKKIDEIIWVALKPIVEGMGLDWKRQSQKVQKDSRYSVISIPFETKGGTQEMLSLNAYHLPAFLYSINPNKVRIDLRDKIISFQNETFKVINEYWNKKSELSQNFFKGKSVLHTINGLKGGLAVKDRKINQLENRVQFLASENESLKIHRIKDNELMNSDIDNKTYTKDDVMKLIEKGLKYDELQEKYFVVATQRDLFNTYATDFIQQANKMKVETEKWEHMKDRLDAIKTNGVEKCKQTGWKAKGYPLYQN